jgi:MFS family permease
MLTIIYTLNYFDRNIFSIVLESIKTDLQLTDTQLGLVGGVAFVMFYSIMGIPIAWLADRYNRRNIIAIGLAFWSMMTACTGLVVNLWQLALTRFLMGAGEATGISPANSMLSDLYDKARRPLAISIMTCGSTLGMFFGYLIGGWVDEHLGWRALFFVGGIPGMLVALIFYLTVKEPERGASETGRVAIDVSSFRETMRFLIQSRTYVIVLIGGCMMAVHLYATLIWGPAFMIRIHELPSGVMGTYMAFARGPTGLLGMLLGGLLVQHLGKVDERWRIRLPALVCMLAAPMEVVFLFADSLRLSLTGLAMASLFTSMYVGPIFAILLGVVKVRMRAMATATFVVCGSFIGQFIGPLWVGYMNDLTQAQFGAHAIRYSLLVGPVFAFLAGVIIWFASRTLVADSHRALEGVSPQVQPSSGL